MNRKNILFLPKWYPCEFDTMSGLFVRLQAIAVSKLHNIAVLYIHSKTNYPENSKYEIEQFDDNGVNTIIIHQKISKYKLIAKFQNFGLLWYYHKIGLNILKQQNFIPDLIHVHVLTRLGVIARRIKNSRKTPYVISEHWSRYFKESTSYKNIIHKYFTRKVVKDASFVIPVSNQLKDAMIEQKLHNSNYQVVPNITDTDLFTISNSSIFTNKKFNLLHVSCFDNNSKNIEGILNVMKRVGQDRDDIVLHLVGDGIDRQKMIDLSKELNIYNKNVFFIGLLAGEPLADYFKSADSLVVFSNFETFCMVVNESLSCGVPVISSNISSIAERVNPSNGILVESKDEEQLYNAIIEMANKKVKYDKESLRKPIVEKYSAEAVSKQLDTIYQKSLANV